MHEYLSYVYCIIRGITVLKNVFYVVNNTTFNKLLFNITKISYHQLTFTDGDDKKN